MPSFRLRAALILLALVAAPVATVGQTPKIAKPYVPPKAIDFSPKHDVLIRSDDGSLQPMDQPYYRAKLIAPGTWQIESDGDYHYLLEGDNEALAIDTGYGAGNLREYLQTLTRKPVRWVANTHFHFDHTANNSYFDRAFMSAGTAERATIPYPSFAGLAFPRDYPRTIVTDGYKIQLGNREIEVMVVPNHTPGGTVYLDKRERILFSGDEIMAPNQPVNVTVADFAANMRKLKARRGEFDRMFGGVGPLEASRVDKNLAAAEAVLAGREGAPPQPFAGGPPGGAVAAGPPDPPGATVYLRRRVRAPDRPANLGGVNENQRVMTYEDTRISYDVRRIR